MGIIDRMKQKALCIEQSAFLSFVKKAIYKAGKKRKNEANKLPRECG